MTRLVSRTRDTQPAMMTHAARRTTFTMIHTSATSRFFGCRLGPEAPVGLTRCLVMGVLLAGGCRTRPAGEWGDLGPSLHQRAERFGTVLASRETHRFQLLVSEVVGSPGGGPRLRRLGYRVDAEYIYPASSIKLCAAVAAIQALEELQAKLDTGDLLDAPLEIAPLFPGDPPQREDPAEAGSAEARPKPITVGREIRKLALVSDNQAFNRLYDLLGHEDLNRRMHALGLRSVVINHRLSESREIPLPRATAGVTLRPAEGEPIVLPARASSLVLSNRAPGTRIGSGYLRGDTVVPGPMDFTARNGISLVDLQDLLVKVVRPDIDLGSPPLVLSPAHRTELLRALTEYPRESTDPRYDAGEYPDGYAKFLLGGVRRVFPSRVPGERIESIGKIGRAYGFSVENACLVHPGTGRTVFVTAVLYTNADGVLNDDRYEYDTLADPFFAELGEWVALRWLRN